MRKSYLVAPGPTPVPERARLAMAKSLIHHRGPEFTEILGEVKENLKWVFQTREDVLVLTTSGTGGFEAAVRTVTRSTDKVVSIGGGKFGERWGSVARSYGLDVIDVPVEWGDAVDLDKLETTLTAHTDADLITVCACETSTGVLHPVREIIELGRKHTNALVAVDGITAVGVHDIPMDDWGIDVLVSGSQKAFSVPPGLAFVAMGERAWKRAEHSDHAGYYLDLRREKAKQANNQTAFTPAISIVVALREVLEMMREEGLEAIFERHDTLARGTRAGLEELGLELFASSPANSVTAAKVPTGISAPDVVESMRESGVTIAGGQANLKNDLIRIGHLGYVTAPDLLIALGALEKALDKCGFERNSRSAIATAQSIYSW